MSIQITDCKEAVSEHQILELERRINSPLPDDYKNFLMQHNGGIPHPDEFCYSENSQRQYATVHYFLAVHDGSYDSIYYCIYMFKEREERVPPNLLPIARDPGGNLICISVSGEDGGKIYFWEHEEEADLAKGEIADYRNVYFIANSFTDFIAEITKF